MGEGGDFEGSAFFGVGKHFLPMACGRLKGIVVVPMSVCYIVINDNERRLKSS